MLLTPTPFPGGGRRSTGAEWWGGWTVAGMTAGRGSSEKEEGHAGRYRRALPRADARVQGRGDRLSSAAAHGPCLDQSSSLLSHGFPDTGRGGARLRLV